MNTSTNLLPLIGAVLAVLGLGSALYAIVQIRSFGKLRKIFLTGKSGSDLETVLYNLTTELSEQEQRQEVADHAIAQLQHDLQFTVQKMGVIRFNPFGDGGGNFSFCIALLDANNTGLVVTSLYGREQNRIYAKRVEQGVSETQLTEEENQAIHKANEKIAVQTI